MRALKLIPLLVGLVAVPAASAETLVVHPHWRPVAGSSDSSFTLQAQGRYVLSGTNTSFSRTLLDERTGKRITVTSPIGCGGPSLSAPWVVTGGCDPFSHTEAHAELFSPSLGTWTPLDSSPSLAPPDCTGSAASDCAVTFGPIGAQWAEVTATDCTGEHCGSAPVYFQNLATGQVVDSSWWKIGGTEVPNLDTASVEQKLCAPLRVPGLFGGRGSIAFYGRFAVAGGTNWNYLERCGSRLHRRLAQAGVYGNSRALAWKSGATVAGIFLPSLRTFRLAKPVPDAQLLAASDRRVFASGYKTGVWAAALPSYHPHRH
jgi:hypothetical protein